MKRIIALTLIAILTACAAERLQTERDKLAGQPEEYKDGYVSGCSSGTKAAGNPYYQFQKDPQRFEIDKLYAQGWNDGFAVCKADYDSIGAALHR